MPRGASGASAPPRSAEPEVRRRLVAAATRLFAERGYEASSVSDIVAAAGVTKGSLYHYFQAKDDLLVEIYNRVLARLLDRLDRLANGPGTPVDRLRAVAVDLVVSTLERLDESVVFARSMHLLAPATGTAVRARWRRYHERFRSLVEDGQGAGLLRTDVSADLAVRFFLGTVQQVSSWYRPDGAWNATQVGNGFAQLLIDGLLPLPGGSGDRSVKRTDWSVTS